MRRSIRVGGRASPLSLAQIREVQAELQQHDPEICFEIVPVTTYGDRDRTTSLRDLGKTDFFTREVDQRQLAGEFRLSVHSAKDLPDPLPEGLVLAALTRGVDASDALVYEETLSQAPLIATSSRNREENVRKLFLQARFTDIRGTIEERLEVLKRGEIDGVVIAKAALIRLGIDDCRQIRLPGETAPLQGRLAVLARADDDEMLELLRVLDFRLLVVAHAGDGKSDQA